jgi:hypothetical protein
MDNDLLFKISVFTQEFRTLVEDGNLFSPISTKVVARAKNIQSPFTTVGAAKAYTTPCIVPISELSLGSDELVLDRYIGNAIKTCDEEWTYLRFDMTEHARRDLYASINVKENALALSDILADATNVGTTRDLSSADLVNNFLIEVKQMANNVVGLRQTIDGGMIKRGEFHGKPFVAAGPDAYRAILSKITTIANTNNSFLASMGNQTRNIVEAPYGVYVIDMSGVTGVNADQLIYGLAGIPTLGYREDKMEVGMGRLVTAGTYAETSPDLDLEDGDAILEDYFYMKAKTVGRNGIFSNVAGLVFKQLMA